MHRYTVASLALPLPLSMLDWWWIPGHCVWDPTKYWLHFTESYCATAVLWKSIQFYIYGMGNFGLGIRFVFLQIMARLFGNVVFAVFQAGWPPTIASGIFPIWAEATPSSLKQHGWLPLPLPLLLLTSLHLSSDSSLGTLWNGPHEILALFLEWNDLNNKIKDDFS